MNSTGKLLLYRMQKRKNEHLKALLTLHVLQGVLSFETSVGMLVSVHMFEYKSSYCGQFHQLFTYEYFVQTHCFGNFFYIHVTREKLPKRHTYKKIVRKTLMKLTPGHNNDV